MKTITKFILLFVLIALLALPVTALAATPQGSELRGPQDEFILGGNFTLESGDTLTGNLWVLGGNATLQPDSRVTGDIMLMGGNLRASGEVSGDVNVMGGAVELTQQAHVRGDVNMVGGSLNRHPNARVDGRVNTAETSPFQFTLPSGVRVPTFEVRAFPFWDIIMFFFRAFLMAALAVLVVMFWPRHAQRISQAAITQPLAAGGLGLLTAVVAPVILLILTITIILIPVTLAGLTILAVMALFGWIGLGLEVGLRMAQLFKQEWALPVSAGLGTLAFTIVAVGLGQLVPCVGWLIPTFLGLVGLGAVLLTRFGTQTYPSYGGPPAPPAPLAPRAPVIPPPPSAPPAGPPPEATPPPTTPETFPEVDTRPESGARPGGAAAYPVDEIVQPEPSPAEEEPPFTPPDVTPPAPEEPPREPPQDPLEGTPPEDRGQ